MFGFTVMLAGLVRVFRGAWRDPSFRGALTSLATLLAVATAFYTVHEGWSLWDSAYFAVMTGLTVGYGDFVPTTALSRVFTVLFSLLSVGLFVSVATTLARVGAEREGPGRPGGVGGS